MSKNKTIIIVLLSIVMGLGGYFGGMMLFSGQHPLGNDAGGEALLTSGIPTDANGNNLIGNTLENLHSGGFIAQQGEDYFYANFDDGGTLYVQDRNGSQTKLTDFAVANLNIRGDVLVFTDLSSSSYVCRNSSQTRYVSATTHEEIWNAAKTTQGISYGGNLYTLTGVRAFCEGLITSGEMVLTQVDDGVFQSPVFTENYLVMLPIRSKDNLLISTEDGDIREIRITQDEDESIVNFIVIDDTAFVQVLNESTTEQYIAKVDLKSDEILGVAHGRGLTVWLERPVFISEENGLIYMWDITDGEDEFLPISRVLPSSDLYSGLPGTTHTVYHGPAFFTKLENGANKLMHLAAVLGDARLIARGGYALADPDGIYIKSLDVTVYVITSVRIEKPAYNPGTTQGCDCGGDEEKCECMESCECGEECGCIHHEIVQDVAGKKEQLYYAGVHKQPWEEKATTGTPDGGTGSPDGGTGSSGPGGGQTGGEQHGPCSCKFGGNCMCAPGTCACPERPQEEEGPFETIMGTAWDTYTGKWWCECGYHAPCCFGLCLGADRTGVCECEEETSSDLVPGGDTGNPNLNVDNPDVGEWYPGEQPEDSVGTMPPSIIRLDDPSKSARSLLPKNLAEYNEFNRRNGGSPPQMDKTRLGSDLESSRFTFTGTSTVRYDYKLNKDMFVKEYRERLKYTDEMINALMSFSLANGFVGDEQATTIKLVFPDETFKGLTPEIEVYDKKQGSMHKQGDNTYYKTAQKEDYWNVEYWSDKEYYLTMFHTRNSYEIGICISFGRDAAGNVIAHGWVVHTDSARSRTFYEINLTVAEKINYAEQDLSAFDGLWYAEGNPNAMGDWSRSQVTMDIQNGRLVRCWVNGIIDNELVGRLYTESPGVTYMFLIKDGGGVHRFSTYVTFISPNEFNLSLQTFKRQ